MVTQLPFNIASSDAQHKTSFRTRGVNSGLPADTHTDGHT
jgi:hypothetical protein